MQWISMEHFSNPREFFSETFLTIGTFEQKGWNVAYVAIKLVVLQKQQKQ